MVQRVTRNLLTLLMEAPDLCRVMVRTVAGLGRGAHDSETAPDSILVVELDQLVGMREFQLSPVLRGTASGTVAAPLGVIVPEDQQLGL